MTVTFVFPGAQLQFCAFKHFHRVSFSCVPSKPRGFVFFFSFLGRWFLPFCGISQFPPLQEGKKKKLRMEVLSQILLGFVELFPRVLEGILRLEVFLCVSAWRREIIPSDKGWEWSHTLQKGPHPLLPHHKHHHRAHFISCKGKKNPTKTLEWILSLLQAGICN